MSPEDKKKLQNDILLAAEISRQFHIRNQEEAEKVVGFLHARKPFLSPRGIAFGQRIEELAKHPEATCTCMLCMQKEADLGIFCEDCLAVIDRSVNGDVKTVEAEPEEEPLMEEPEEKPVEEQIEETPEVEELPELEEAIESPVVDTDLWGPVEKPRKKLPIWAWVLIGILVVVVGGVGVLLATGYQLPIGTVHVESAEEGANVVEREYSPKEYDIREKESLNAPEGMFEVKVGEYVGDSWGSELIAVYAYSVVSKKDPRLSAVLWVAEDGRVVGYGSLIDSEDVNKIYRVH